MAERLCNHIALAILCRQRVFELQKSRTFAMGGAARKFEVRHVDLAQYQSLQDSVFGAKSFVPLEDAKRALGQALGLTDYEEQSAFSELPPQLARCKGKQCCWRATFAAAVVWLARRWKRYNKADQTSVKMLEVSAELRDFLDKRINEPPPPYCGVPQPPGGPFMDTKMNHGGPKTPTPFLLSPPIEGSSQALAGVTPAPKDESIVAGMANGFQFWRWCVTPSLRQFVALPDHPCPAECFVESPPHSNTVDEGVVLLELGGYQVKWRGFRHISPLITLEWNGFILYTTHPEGHAKDAGSFPLGDR